jgi:dihydroorotate dehydrogenase
LLGFGHIELGTVTPSPQPGNPRPRLFRLVEDRALVNRMGFPSRGAGYLASRLARNRSKGVILGVNLGMNKDTPLQEAWRDYQVLLTTFAPLANYLAINVSSPNTPGLRQLQGYQELEELLGILNAERRIQEANLGRRVPLLVKLALDLSLPELERALDVIMANDIDGVIAANTTLSRAGLKSPLARESGGLSGQPLSALSTQMIREITRFTQGRLPVIGVGGVMTPFDAQEKLAAGATLVQVYTGLVYRGPGLVGDIVRAL